MAIRQKGAKWQVDVTYKGQRAPRVSCDTKTEAQRIEAEFKAELMRGVPADRLVTPSAAKVVTKGTLGDMLHAAHRTFWAGRKSEVTSLKNATAWTEELGDDFPLLALDTDKISEVCDRWAASGNAAGTINRKLAALSVMLGLAEERGHIQRKPRLPKRKEYEGRLRYYSDDEVESLMAHVSYDPDVHDLFIAAVETGLRQGELLDLTKRDIDTRGKLALLGETKGNKRRSVPLTNKAAEAFARRADGKMDHEKLFPARITTSHLSRVIRAWKHQRGLPAADEACFHTFRHTTCSRLVQRGVPLSVVQKFMGHAHIVTTMRYAHLAPDSLDMAREALEGSAA